MHAALLAQLRQFPVPHRYVVALSGGCDSISLLHALVQIRDELPCRDIAAVHINHGLQAASDDWQQHCQTVCQDWGIPLQTKSLSLMIPKGDSPEAYAREQRYAAMASYLKQGDMLLLAHHQDDQAETLLLQLLRGSGPRGLAGMPAIVEQAHGWTARPLLGVTRDEIVRYARQANLVWHDDPSNSDVRYDRNYVRHHVLPALLTRWPGATTTLSRAALHQAELAGLLDDLAELDWGRSRSDDERRLAMAPLRTLSVSRQRNLLRYWISRVCGFPVPDSVHLQRIIDEVIPAQSGADPMVEWAGVQVRRYRDTLLIGDWRRQSQADWQASWDMQSPLTLPSGEVMCARAVAGAGLKLEQAGAPVQVRFRQGGERCRLPGREHHHELKKLFQSWGVPPWQRDQVPLVYIGDQLAQVVGYSVCEPFVATQGQHGVEIYVRNQ